MVRNSALASSANSKRGLKMLALHYALPVAQLLLGRCQSFGGAWIRATLRTLSPSGKQPHSALMKPVTVCFANRSTLS